MKKSKFLGRKISLVTERKPAFEPHLLLTPSVVNVNHQKLIDLDVVSEQQLLLMKRVIERRILDCILASDYIKACIAFGSSITKSDIKLFLNISADIYRLSQQRQMHELLAEINANLLTKFNLGHLGLLAKLLYQSIESWLLKRYSNEETNLYKEYQELQVLKSQLETKLKFWQGLIVNDVNRNFLETQTAEAQSGLQECQIQLSKLKPDIDKQNAYREDVVEERLSILKELIFHDVSPHSFSSCLAHMTSGIPELTGVLSMINELVLGHDIDSTSLGLWLTRDQTMPSHFLFEIEANTPSSISPVWQWTN